MNIVAPEPCPGSFGGSAEVGLGRENDVPIVKMLRTHCGRTAKNFPAKNAVDCRILDVQSHFSGGDTPGPSLAVGAGDRTQPSTAEGSVRIQTPISTA